MIYIYSCKYNPNSYILIVHMNTINLSYSNIDMDTNIQRKAQQVNGLYTDLDIRLLHEALLQGQQYSSTEILPPTVNEKSHDNNNVDDIYQNIRDALENKEVKQILFPVNINDVHWVTCQLLLDHDNKEISAYVHDSLGLHKELEILKNLTISEDWKIENIKSEVSAIQDGNVYCGGYSAHLIANLALNPAPITEQNKSSIWGCKDPDKEMRKQDLQTIITIQPDGYQDFGTVAQEPEEMQKKAEHSERDRNLKIQQVTYGALNARTLQDISEGILQKIRAKKQEIRAKKPLTNLQDILEGEENILPPEETSSFFKSLVTNIENLDDIPRALRHLYKKDTTDQTIVMNSYYQPNQLIYSVFTILDRIEEEQQINQAAQNKSKETNTKRRKKKGINLREGKRTQPPQWNDTNVKALGLENNITHLLNALQDNTLLTQIKNNLEKSKKLFIDNKERQFKFEDIKEATKVKRYVVSALRDIMKAAKEPFDESINQIDQLFKRIDGNVERINALLEQSVKLKKIFKYIDNNTKEYYNSKDLPRLAGLINAAYSEENNYTEDFQRFYKIEPLEQKKSLLPDITYTFKDKRYSTHTITKLNKNSPIIFKLGEISDNCIRINAVGKECITDILTKPDCDAYVVRDGNKENGKIIGTMVAWISDVGNLCIDSLEMASTKDVHKDEEIRKLMFKEMKGFASDLIKNDRNIKRVTLGLGSKTPKEFKEFYNAIKSNPHLDEAEKKKIIPEMGNSSYAADSRLQIQLADGNHALSTRRQTKVDRHNILNNINNDLKLDLDTLKIQDYRGITMIERMLLSGEKKIQQKAYASLQPQKTNKKENSINNHVLRIRPKIPKLSQATQQPDLAVSQLFINSIPRNDDNSISPLVAVRLDRNAPKYLKEKQSEVIEQMKGNSLEESAVLEMSQNAYLIAGEYGIKSFCKNMEFDLSKKKEGIINSLKEAPALKKFLEDRIKYNYPNMDIKTISTSMSNDLSIDQKKVMTALKEIVGSYIDNEVNLGRGNDDQQAIIDIIKKLDRKHDEKSIFSSPAQKFLDIKSIDYQILNRFLKEDNINDSIDNRIQTIGLINDLLLENRLKDLNIILDKNESKYYQEIKKELKAVQSLSAQLGTMTQNPRGNAYQSNSQSLEQERGSLINKIKEKESEIVEIEREDSQLTNKINEIDENSTKEYNDIETNEELITKYKKSDEKEKTLKSIAHNKEYIKLWEERKRETHDAKYEQNIKSCNQLLLDNQNKLKEIDDIRRELSITDKTNVTIKIDELNKENENKREKIKNLDEEDNTLREKKNTLLEKLNTTKEDLINTKCKMNFINKKIEINKQIINLSSKKNNFIIKKNNLKRHEKQSSPETAANFREAMRAANGAGAGTDTIKLSESEKTKLAAFENIVTTIDNEYKRQSENKQAAAQTEAANAEKPKTFFGNVIDKLKNRSTEIEIKKSSVTILPEQDHKTDHSTNLTHVVTEIAAMPEERRENIVIFLERKDYGDNRGIKDMKILAATLEYNKNKPKEEQIAISEPPDSNLYLDAVSYNTFKDMGVKVVGAEGKGLAVGQHHPDYGKLRDEGMTDNIMVEAKKGKEIILLVGSAHVEPLQKKLGASDVDVKVNDIASQARETKAHEGVSKEGRVQISNSSDTQDKSPTHWQDHVSKDKGQQQGQVR